jgi:hypothetical protein
MHACDDAAVTRNGQRDRDCDRDSAMAAATVRHASAIATATALRRAANTPLCPTPNAMARKRPHIVWDTKRNISPCDSGMHNLHGTSTHGSGQHAALQCITANAERRRLAAAYIMPRYQV